MSAVIGPERKFLDRLVVASICFSLVGGCSVLFDPEELRGGPDAREPRDSPPWWRDGYRFRRPIFITTEEPVPVWSSLRVVAATDGLIAGGKLRADGNDWRVVHHTDGGPRELDRWVEEARGGFDTATTHTWFRVEQALAPDAGGDYGYYLYYGNEDEDEPAPARPDEVFLVADDFEAGLDQWMVETSDVLDAPPAQAQGEVYRAGAGALSLTSVSGTMVELFRPVSLPGLDLAISHHVRQEQDIAALGNLRLFGTSCEDRSRDWRNSDMRAGNELSSDRRLRIWSDRSVFEWYSGVGVGDWHRIEFQYQQDENLYRARLDGGGWSDWYNDYNRLDDPVRCVGVATQGNGDGRFYMDDYIIRVLLDPEPEVAVGAEEPRP